MPTDEAPAPERVERWARAMCVDAGVNPDGRYGPAGAPWWTGYIGRAEQAIALADAEAVAGDAVPAGLRAAAERARFLIDLRADENDTAGHAAVAELDRCLAAAPTSGQAEGGGTGDDTQPLARRNGDDLDERWL